MTSGNTGDLALDAVGPDPGGKEWLAAIVESSTDAIIGKKLDGTITDWNAGAAEMYGYQAGEMIGRNISDIIPADRKNELDAIMDDLRRGARVEPFETRRVRNDGTLLDVSVSISPVRGSDGAVIGAASVARDISGRLRAEAERRAAIERAHLSERLESVGLIVGGLAHDFNNMLGVVIGYGEQISEKLRLDPGVRSDVENILVAGQRAAELTKELMGRTLEAGNSAEALRLLDAQDCQLLLTDYMMRGGASPWLAPPPLTLRRARRLPVPRDGC